MHRPTRLTLDLAALAHNARVMRAQIGDAFFCPMLKAGAYGHGDLLAARALAPLKPSAFGVALVEEGVRVRQAGVDTPILVFAPFDHAGLMAMREHQLTPVLTGLKDLEVVLAAAAAAPLAVHVKLNTGMQRLGFDLTEVPRLMEQLARAPWVRVEGVCTHLTHGEDFLEADGPSARQMARFHEFRVKFPNAVTHLQKSASLAVLGARAAALGFGARPGISLYGLAYDGDCIAPGLKPVATWSSQLARVHRVNKGEAVGYSSRWRASRASVVGVVPVGYADGYARGYSPRAEMLFRERRVPVIGSVCMDYTFVDLTDAHAEGEAHAGEPIVMLGRQGASELPAHELAGLLGTISYEVVTAISARVPRVVNP